VKAVSILRNFSAPVQIEQNLSDEQLGFLAQEDSDPFNRWDALQQLAGRAILKIYYEEQDRESAANALIKAFSQALANSQLDPAYLTQLLSLPSESVVAEQIHGLFPLKLRQARQKLLAQMADVLEASVRKTYKATHSQCEALEADLSPKAAGLRSLRNLSLSLLCQQSQELAKQTALGLAQTQFEQARCMSSRWGAFAALLNLSGPHRQDTLDRFEAQYQDEPLLMDKWFQAQATSVIAGKGQANVLMTVQQLAKRNDFSLKNPNRTRALVHSFCQSNLAEFHREDGQGYIFWENYVSELDRMNPQVSARLARSLDRWRKFAPSLQQHMKASLERLSQTASLSGDVREVIQKALTTP
jgi:aminopeptidase N